MQRAYTPLEGRSQMVILIAVFVMWAVCLYLKYDLERHG